MKRQISCWMMVLALMLLGTSGVIEAASVLVKTGAKVVAKEATEAGIRAAAAKVLAKTGQEATEEAIGALAKSMQAGLTKMGTAGTDDALKTMTANLKMMTSAGVDLGLLAGKSADDMAKYGQKTLKIDDLTKLGISNDQAKLIMQKQVGSKLAGMMRGKATRKAVEKLKTGTPDEAVKAAKKLAKMSGGTADDATKMVSKAERNAVEKLTTKALNPTSMSGKGLQALGDAGSETSKAFKKLMGHSDDVVQQGLQRQINEAAATGNQTLAKELSGQLKTIRYNAASPVGKVARILKTPAQYGMSFAKYASAGLFGAVLFMLPTIFQSAFLAEQAHNALLQTYIPPIQFGNIVMQLPDSVIKEQHPEMSQFIYCGIPVTAPGASLSAAAKKAYPGVSGPTNKNKVSSHVSSKYSKTFSAGASKSLALPRYNLNPKALASLQYFVSYSLFSYVPWASEAAFVTSLMLNLNTGYIFSADGTAQGNQAAPLAGVGGAMQSVETFLPIKMAQLKSANAQASYTEYVDAYSSRSAGVVSQVIIDQFDCKCLDKNGGVLSADVVKSCSATKNPTCMLTSALNKLAAGLVINSQGTELTPDQNLADEIAKGALGQVIPIQGLDTNFEAVLQMFPGAEKNALANSGALTISLGTDMSASSKAAVIGAAPDNYSAKGVYIYQCQNTPLAKMLRSQAGGSATSAYLNQLTDYVVFLDVNLNQVPLMAPVQDPTNYNFIKMGLNPAIAFVSTIIGNMDSSGNFSFLPQLNIQSPEALIAKGLPATFAPLYGLQAAKGTLSINYNQTLPSVIGTIVQSLAANPKLGQQFKTIQSALVDLLTAGPFGKYNLKPIDSNMQPNIGGINLVLYTGFNSFPVAQDAAHANCTDVLIPMSAAGKTITLPSNSVTQYYGLVTDITYNVNPDGTLVVAPNGLANSPLEQSYDPKINTIAWKVNQEKVSEFYWMSKLTAMGQSGDEAFAMPAALVTFVSQARTAWISWIESVDFSALANVEFAGATIPGTSTVCTIANQQVLSEGVYIYTVSPNPSNLPLDYFVLTNSQTPQATDKLLGKISATKATAATNLLSIVSGQLYNSSGALVKNNAGPAYKVDAKTLLQTLNSANPKAFSTAFKQSLNVVNGQAASGAKTLVYPFDFGGVQLGIYQADLNANNYLYVDAAGAGASADFSPTDYFVTVDSYTKPVIVSTQLSSTTRYIVSLVSGDVYGPTSLEDVMAPALLSSLIATLSPAWQPGVAKQIANLAANYAAEQKYLAQQSVAEEKAAAEEDRNVTWQQAAVVSAITGLASQEYLPRPYNAIKQDATSGNYVLVSPANAESTEFAYTFFDVPNNFVDSKGGQLHVGAMYDSKGNLLRVISGIELVSMLQQYGIAVDSKGKQSLGASSNLPIMKLDPADITLRPGVSGKSMVYSNDAAFPSRGIVSPIAYNNAQFYIYFNTIMRGYYAMQVKGSDISYIDMAGGNVYNQDGSPQVQLNPVAFNASGDKTDMLLAYLNPDGFVESVIKNPSNNNVYSDFLNFEDNFESGVADAATNEPCGLNYLISLDDAATSVSIAQMPYVDIPDLDLATTYNVYWTDSEVLTYNVDASYQWQNLQLLPIDMQTRAISKPIPAELYASPNMILKNKAPYACIFANELYGDAKKQGDNVYIMSSGSNSITCSMLVDSKTNVAYVSIVSGGVTYNYQYLFKDLNDAQVVNYHQNIWQLNVVSDTNGKILLTKNLPSDDSGNVQLSPASIKDVVNASSNPSIADRLDNILKDVANDRFMVAVGASTYPYLSDEAYVDIETGILFSSTGVVIGFSLQLLDLTALLRELSFSVGRDKNNRAALQYHVQSASRAESQAADQEELYDEDVEVQSENENWYSEDDDQDVAVQADEDDDEDDDEDEDEVEVQSDENEYSEDDSAPEDFSESVESAPMQEVASEEVAPEEVAPVEEHANAQEHDAASDHNHESQDLAAHSVAVVSASQAAPVVVNPKVVALEKKNSDLNADIANRNEKIAELRKSKDQKSPNITNELAILNRAINIDKDQIAANNKEIAALQASGNHTRSTLLGRLSSKFKSKKNRK